MSANKVFEVSVTSTDGYAAVEYAAVIGVFDTREAAEQVCAEFDELCALLSEKWNDRTYVEINERTLNARMSVKELLREFNLCSEDDEEMFMQVLQNPHQTHVWGGIVKDIRREEN